MSKNTIAAATMELLSQALEPFCEKIIEKLADEHKIEVTIDWLMNAMTLPYQKKSATTVSSTTAKPSNRTFKPGDGKNGCVYVFTKGVNKGSHCGKKTEDDSNFCKQCAKKGSAQKSVDDSVAPRSATVPVKRSLTTERKNKAPQDLEQMEDGRFLHKPSGFIVETAPRGKFKAVAKLEEDEELDLEDDDFEEVTKLGFITDNQDLGEGEPEEKESQAVPGAVTMNGLTKSAPARKFNLKKATTTASA